MTQQIKQLISFFCTLIFLCHVSFASADTASDTDTLLNWAESNYPAYFPTHQTTQSIAPWLFRFYPETNVYAGVNTNDNGVYVFGGPWGNANPTYIDNLPNLLLAANNGKLTSRPCKIHLTVAVALYKSKHRQYMVVLGGSG